MQLTARNVVYMCIVTFICVCDFVVVFCLRQSAYIHMLAQCLPVYVDTKYYLAMNFKFDRFYASTRICCYQTNHSFDENENLQSKY